MLKLNSVLYTCIVTTVTSAATDPTLKSIPPLMMTSSMPARGFRNLPHAKKLQIAEAEKLFRVLARSDDESRTTAASPTYGPAGR